MHSDPLVEIFVLCRNRRDFVVKTIDSLVAQTYRPIRIVISDNSTNDDIAALLKVKFPALEIRCRRPALASYDHFNQVLTEATAPYLMIFHDDDVLNTDAVAQLVNGLERTGAVAACGNACILLQNVETNQLINPALDSDTLIAGPRDLALRYLDYSAGVNPFPGYVYRRAAIAGLKSDFFEAGQYCDVTFVLKVAERGAILWFARPLMYYRKHGNNMSGQVSLLGAKKMTRFLVTRGWFEAGEGALREFRYWNHLFDVRNRKREGRHTHRAQLKLVVSHFVRHPGQLWHKIMRKYLGPNTFFR